MTATLLSLLLACGMLGGDDGTPGKDDAAAKPEKVEKNPPPRDAEQGKRGRGGMPPMDGHLPTAPMAPIEAPCGHVDRGAYLYPFTFEGTDYEVALFIGEGEGPRDLAVLLHPGGGGAASMLKKTRLQKRAIQEGFVVVAPESTNPAGMGPRWLTGKFREDLKERMRPGEVLRDDVAFLDARAKDLARDVCVNHVTAVGFSSGGQMAHRWACKGDQVDAIVTAAGTLIIEDDRCRRPTPVLSYIGTKDRLYRESPNERYPEMPSAPEAMELWKKHNKCKGKTIEKRVSKDTTCHVTKGCAAATQMCVVEGMPHRFPAARGDKAVDFDGADYGWQWVQNEAKKR